MDCEKGGRGRSALGEKPKTGKWRYSSLHLCNQIFGKKNEFH